MGLVTRLFFGILSWIALCVWAAATAMLLLIFLCAFMPGMPWYGRAACVVFALCSAPEFISDTREMFSDKPFIRALTFRRQAA